MSVRQNLEMKLSDLDQDLKDFYEKKDIPGTPEYEAAQQADKILAQMFHKPGAGESAKRIISNSIKVSYK